MTAHQLTRDEIMAIVAMAANGMVSCGLHRTLDDQQRHKLGTALVSTRAFLIDNTDHAMAEAATLACVGAIHKLVEHLHVGGVRS